MIDGMCGELLLTLGGGWVDSDRVIEVALRRCIWNTPLSSGNPTLNILLLTAHFNSCGKALKHLVAPHADDVKTDDAFFWPDAHELEHRWFFVFGRDHGEVESTERRCV
jgi:hypothetical protein